MAKLTGAKKRAFLLRMAKGRANKGKKSIVKRRKTARPSTKIAKVKKQRKPRKSNNMAKRKSRSSSRRSKIGGIFGNSMIRKAMMGIGAGALAGTITSMVMPQFTPIAKPVSALIAGGPIGAVASILIDGGLGSFGSLLGGNTQQGGLSV